MDRFTIPATSLLGELLSSWEEAAHISCTDPDGYCDHVELGHELEQLDDMRADLERDVDILEVFASEIARGV